MLTTTNDATMFKMWSAFVQEVPGGYVSAGRIKVYVIASLVLYKNQTIVQ